MDYLDKFKKHGWNGLEPFEQNMLAVACFSVHPIEKFYKDILVNEILYKDFGTYKLMEQSVLTGFYSKSHITIYHKTDTDTYWMITWQEDKFNRYTYEFDLYQLEKCADGFRRFLAYE